MRRIVEFTDRDGRREAAAEVELREDGSVTVRYGPRTESLREEWEEVGVVAFDRTVRVSDGRAFFDALPRAYANSTWMRVIDVD